MVSDLENLFKICSLNLRSSDLHYSYLKKRGFDDSIINRYQIGYFPQNIQTLKKYVSRDLLLKLNIINYSNNSDFSDYFSLIFPIRSEYGDPVGISGRVLLEESQRVALNISKYKNSSYKKSKVFWIV